MKRTTRLLVIFAVGLGILCAVSAVVRVSVVSELADGDLAAQWQAGDTEYVHVSAFISEEAQRRLESFLLMGHNVDNALAAVALEPENENARLWADAYSGDASVTVSNEYNTQTAIATCTGGDYFLFHPVEMLSGWYYSENDNTDTLVILDENLAWRLFGGTDIAGMALEINGYACTVAGVSKVPDDEDELAAYGEELRLYMTCSFYERQGQDISLTCYEALVPEPVTGFGLETIEAALGLSESQCELEQNTGRYSLKSSLETAGEYRQRAQRINKIYYPWWENYAKGVDSQNALWGLLTVFFAGATGIVVLVPGAKLFIHCRRKVSRSRHGKGNAQRNQEDL